MNLVKNNQCIIDFNLNTRFNYIDDQNGMAVYTKEYESLEAQTKDGLKLFFVFN